MNLKDALESHKNKIFHWSTVTMKMILHFVSFRKKIEDEAEIERIGRVLL